MAGGSVWPRLTWGISSPFVRNVELKLGSLVQSLLSMAGAGFVDPGSNPFLLVDSKSIAGDANKVDTLIRGGWGSVGDIETQGGFVPLGVGYVGVFETFVNVTGDAISDEAQFSGTGILYYRDVSSYWRMIRCNYTFDGSGKVTVGWFPQEFGQKVQCSPAPPP